MKLKIVRQIITIMSKALLYGIFTQCLFLGILWAEDGKGQEFENKSIEEIDIKLNNEKAALKKVFGKIEQQTGFTFSYHNSMLRQQEIKTEKKSVVLGDFLRDISKKYHLSFKRVNETIAVAYQKNEPSETEVIEEINLLQLTISGKVTSSDGGEPLPGVSILIKGTSNGTTTNMDGDFSLQANQSDILQFSFIGYATQEVTVSSQSKINVALQPDLEQLEEVVVVGYGTQKKSDLTGSVTSIKADQLKATPIVSLDQGLQGRAAGVQVTQQSHQPGGGVSIRVRGGNSLTAGTEPLYVIDGFPIYSDNSAFAAGNSNTGSTPNALSSLNPSDIESIEILKDASATAIYGSRGANGVVIITTKRGKEGKVKVEFDAYYGVQNVANKLDVLNAEEYLTILNEGRVNDGLTPVTLEEPFVGVDTDWQDEIYNTASMANYQLSISGGNEKARYAISGNLFEQEGIINNSDFQRASLRLNMDNEITDKIKLGVSATYSSIVNNNIVSDRSGGGGAFASISSNALLMPPVSPITNNGTFFRGPNPDNPIEGIRLDNLFNPAWVIDAVENELVTNRFLTNIFTSIELAKGLNLRVSGGVDDFSSKRNFFFPNLTPQDAGSTNNAQLFNTKVRTWLNENTLTYDFSINDDHKFNLVAGFTQQTQIRETSSLAGLNVSEVTSSNAIQSASGSIFIGSNKQRWDLLSWLGRANYNLMGKYLFTVTARYDGSSRFGENNKWGFFPSAAFAWRLSEETFINDLNLFSDLKFRTSYGITGNQEIGVLNSQPLLFFTNTAFNDGIVPGVVSGGPAFPDLQWERTSQFDIGLDMGFVKDRVRLTLDYYQKVTEDLLFNLPTPRTSGVSSILQNVGSIENRGFELGLSSNNLVGEFKWESNVVLSLNENELTELPTGITDFTLGNSDGHIAFGRPFRFEVGQPIGNFFGFVTNGIWQTDEVAALDEETALGLEAKAGEIKYVDTNSDGVINDADRQVIGNALPTTNLGITNTFSYKGFDLSIFFNGMFGHQVLNYQNFEGIGVQGRYGENNHFSSILDRWTPENPSNTTPKATNGSRPVRLSDLIVENASFLRLQNVSLGYTFNTSKINWLSSARVYVSGQNLAIWTDYSGYDPEVNSGGQNTRFDIGIDRGAYPAARTFLIGTNLTF